MTGDSGSDRDICGLAVTYLTDHYDVRVLTEDRSQRSREGHTCLGVDLALVYTVDLFLDRVLNCYNVYVRLGKLAEGSVQCSRFTGTCRACNQHNSVRAADYLLEHLVVIIRHTEVGYLSGLFICGGEQSDNALLAVNAGDSRYTDVQVDTVDLHTESAVQRDTLLSDVHTAEDLDTRDKGVMQRDGNLHSLLLHKLAVYSESDTRASLERLDMDI